MGRFEKRKEKFSAFVRFFYPNKRIRLRKAGKNCEVAFLVKMFTIHCPFLLLLGLGRFPVDGNAQMLRQFWFRWSVGDALREGTSASLGQ
jgi:hypothetical protein